MRNIYIILFLCLGSSILMAQKPLNTAETNAFKEKVKQLDGSTKTIVSDFVQYKHLNFLNNDVQTAGKLVFKTPNLIKWEYTSPYKYSVIFKENKIFINDEGAKTKIDIGSNKMFKTLNNVIANSVKGNMFNDEEFEISYFKTEQHYLITFIPKDKNMLQFILKFELIFDSTTNDVTEVKMIEPSEDYTKIMFKNKKRNTPVSYEVFNH